MMLVARTSARPGASARLLQLLSRGATPEGVAVGRIGAGAAMTVRPSLLPATLGVDPVSAGRTAWAVQMLGARDLALGVGTLLSLRRGDARASRLWLAAGLLSDAVDALAISRAMGRGSVDRAAGAAAVGVAVAAVAVEAAALVHQVPVPLRATSPAR
jgi:hypothetical protein